MASESERIARLREAVSEPRDLPTIRRSLRVACDRFSRAAARSLEEGREQDARWATQHAINLESARILLGGRARRSEEE
jgi:hypothetical protein